MLMMSYVCLLLVYLFVPSNGLDCLHCANVAFSSTVATFLPEVARQIKRQLTTPACVVAQPATNATGVTLDRCTAVPQTGQVNKCGSLVGTLIVSTIASRPTISVDVHAHIRGCFSVDQNVEGCVTDKSIINQQRGILSNALKVISSVEVKDFDGRLCVNKSIRTQQSCWIVISMLVIFLFLYLE